MSAMTTLVKFPSKSRPRLFASTFAKWYADESVRFLITLNRDDETLGEYIRTLALYDQSRIKIRQTDVKSKIEAVNDGVAEEDWELCILAADDMLPQFENYNTHVKRLFTENFPDGDGVLHLNDGIRGEGLNTLPILDRRYFDRTGYIYHPAYTSVFADDEFTEVSRRLGRAKYVDAILIKHEWIGRHGRDELCDWNESFYAADQEIFEKRQRAGFP